MASQERDTCAQSEENEHKDIIRRLNDGLRCHQTGGQLFATSGIIALGQNIIPQIMEAIAQFDDFSPDNDPHGEHDFGSIVVQGHTIFWKIDYYDKSMEYGSPDPAAASVTTRVLTVMLAHEY